MSEILRDIEKEIKRERWLKLWRAYRVQVLLGAAAIFIGVGLMGSLYLYNKSKTQEASADFDIALGLEDKTALVAFEILAKKGGVYGDLASFHQAALLAKKGRRKKAAAIYDRLSSSSYLTPPLKDLARIYGAQTLLPVASYKEIEQMLAPAISSNRYLRYSALEILALAAIGEKNSKQAKNLLQPLVEDKNVPRTTAARARIMLDKLSSQK